LKQGFLFENIEVIEKYDSDSEPGKIISQEPKYGELVSTDIAVKIYVNSYQEEEEE
ncbi:MAG: PASTA domain-containing protein, partial [Clostridia bacterium]|nr:PASTA domain-containing protein [Clostridia bacterium]